AVQMSAILYGATRGFVAGKRTPKTPRPCPNLPHMRPWVSTPIESAQHSDLAIEIFFFSAPNGGYSAWAADLKLPDESGSRLGRARRAGRPYLIWRTVADMVPAKHES